MPVSSSIAVNESYAVLYVVVDTSNTNEDSRIDWIKQDSMSNGRFCAIARQRRMMEQQQVKAIYEMSSFRVYFLLLIQSYNVHLLLDITNRCHWAHQIYHVTRVGVSSSCIARVNRTVASS
jgi:hypothetical protein